MVMCSPTTSTFSGNDLCSSSLGNSATIFDTSMQVAFPFFTDIALRSGMFIFAGEFLLVAFAMSTIASTMVF